MTPRPDAPEGRALGWAEKFLRETRALRKAPPPANAEALVRTFARWLDGSGERAPGHSVLAESLRAWVAGLTDAECERVVDAAVSEDGPITAAFRAALLALVNKEEP